MPAVLTGLDQATPDWLTMILQREGVLDRGQVVAVAQERVASSSQVAHLTFVYTRCVRSRAHAPGALRSPIPTWSG